MSKLYHPVQLPLFVIYKVCPACNPPTLKHIDEFTRDRTTKDGHRPYCKKCNYIKIKAIQTKEHPSYAAKLAYNREYKASHQPRQRDPATYKAYSRAHAKRYPKRMRESVMRHYALKKATMVQKVDYERILERDGMWCYICEKDILPSQKLQFDHVIPLIPRPGEPLGTHTEENIKPTHSVCNNRKQNRRFEDLTPYQRRGVN